MIVTKNQLRRLVSKTLNEQHDTDKDGVSDVDEIKLQWAMTERRYQNLMNHSRIDSNLEEELVGKLEALEDLLRVMGVDAGELGQISSLSEDQFYEWVSYMKQDDIDLQYSGV